MSNSFNFLIYKYKIYSFSGKVVAQDSYINSKEFFLVSSEGNEKSFSLHDSKLPPLRLGHVIQVMWVIKEGKKTGKYVLVRNVSLDKDVFIISNINSTSKGMIAVVIILSMLFFIVLVVFGLLSYIYIDLTGGTPTMMSWIVPLCLLIIFFSIGIAMQNRFRKKVIVSLLKNRLKT